MNSKKKIIILSSIILGVLVVVLGLTYAAFTYDRTGNNSDLVLGDIYMHYKENNQLMFNDAMPTSIEKYYTSYKVNPVMATQQVKNELTTCINIVSHYDIDQGSTPETYCKGTGTWMGSTFQEQLVDNWFPPFVIAGMLSLNIITQDGENYLVNPIMKNQIVEEINELTTCITFYGVADSDIEFDEGSTAESFCKGTGTRNGMTIQEDLDAWIERAKEYDYDFLETGGQALLDDGVIIPQIENLPYFEFTISGKNTYLDEDIWFEIVLNHGDDHETRTTRIRDELLRFTLVEVVGEDTKTTLFNNRKYNDLSNKRIWVETIKANTTSEINKTYRLYAWISEETVIGNVNEDYTTEEWNDVFASIKVNVTGDFNEKELQLEYEEMYDVTDASCFETSLSTKYIVNSNMTEEELNACVNYLNQKWGEEQEGITVDVGETYVEYCRGTGTNWGNRFQTHIDDHWFLEEELIYFETENIIIGIPGLSITDYDSNCGSDVVIPKTINGYNVIKINNPALQIKNLTSVVIPNSVIEIEVFAFANNYISSVIFEKNSTLSKIEPGTFSNNQLVSIVIPNSVISIGQNAFKDNLLTKVIFEENSKLEEIYDSAFAGTNRILEVTLPNSVTYFECGAFNDDVIINKNEELICSAGPS